MFFFKIENAVHSALITVKHSISLQTHHLTYLNTIWKAQYVKDVGLIFDCIWSNACRDRFITIWKYDYTKQILYESKVLEMYYRLLTFMAPLRGEAQTESSLWCITNFRSKSQKLCCCSFLFIADFNKRLLL